jgi:glutamate carboxypeptidase
VDHILKHLEQQQNAMLKMLREFVEHESPSTEKTAVDRLGRLVATELRETGAKVTAHRSAVTGNHLEARWPASAGENSWSLTARTVMLLGHLDTVWPMKTISRMPYCISAGRAYGPGIYDMKAGIVIGIFALRCLRELGLRAAKPLTFLLNADEEVGSASSRVLTENLAQRCAAALVLEPSAGPRGALKTARKGVGEFRIRVVGKAAHSGLDPEKGASAVIELAKQLLIIQSFTNGAGGITLNPGVIHGGTRTNVVAAEAEAMIDVRVTKQADGGRFENRLRKLKPKDKRTSIEITGGMNRPPFERSPAGDKLFRTARELARTLGIDVTEAWVGGGSDGNFTAAMGVPTLDGLGAVGDGAHAAHEHVIMKELPMRAALLAHLILNLAT